MLKQIERESHVEVLVHGTLKAVVGLLPSLPLQPLHRGLHLLHLLLVRLHEAVSKPGGEAGCLLQEGFAVEVGGDSNLSGKPCHLPHLQDGS